MSTRTISFNDGFSSATAPTGVDGISNWVTAQAYLVSDVVIQGSKIYECLIAHTAGVFATDLAAVKWGEISQGAVDHTALSNIGTNTHAQIDSHISSTSNPHSVTKAQVGLTNVDDTSDATKNAASVTLTNKTITGADIRTPTRLDMKQDTLSNLTTYASTAADGQLCFATDTKATYVVKNSSLSSVGGAGAGINYILAPDADSGTTGWATYADAAGTSPVDGTGGAPSSTFAASASSPLRGTSSFLWTKSAANRQGEGFSYDFTIDASDKGKILTCSFEYQIASGTFADDDMSVWIYDVTNASLIQPAPYLIKNSGIIEKFAVEFQTASNSTSYRLIVHTGSTSASAYTIKFDNFILGPQAKLYGSAITDWVNYAPNLSTVGILSNSAYWRRNGDSIEIEGRMEFNGGGSASTLTVGVPTGITIDTAKIVSLSSSSIGVGYWSDSGVGFFTLIARSNNATTFSFYQQAGTASFNTTVCASGDVITYNVKIPVAGWSSSQVFSQDADTRVVSFKGDASTTLAATANVTNITFSSVKDSHSSWNGSQYTLVVPGDYRVSSTMADSASSTVRPTVYLNGASNTLLGSAITGEFGGGSTIVPNLKAGDVLSIRIPSSVTIAATRQLSIERISGPSQIAASESVVCNYVTTAAQSIPNSTITTVLFGTKIHDSHNAYATGTGIFTAPMSGVYLVNASIDYTPTNTTGYRSIHAVGNSVDRTLFQNNAQSIYQQVAGSTTFRLLAGQTISIYALHSKGSAETLTASDAVNYMSIYRIGSY